MTSIAPSWKDFAGAPLLRCRAPQNDHTMVRAAVVDYLSSGYEAHLTREELVEFFCVSRPSVLDERRSTDRVAEIRDELSWPIYQQRVDRNSERNDFRE